MTFIARQHEDTCLLLPCVVLNACECENPQCGEIHRSIEVSWFIWSIGVVLS